MSATAVLRPQATEWQRAGIVKQQAQTTSQLSRQACRLVYDAECRLCVSVKSKLERVDIDQAGDQVRFLAYQSEEASKPFAPSFPTFLMGRSYCEGCSSHSQSSWQSVPIGPLHVIGIDGLVKSSQLNRPPRLKPSVCSQARGPSLGGTLPTARNLPTTCPPPECVHLVRRIHALHLGFSIETSCRSSRCGPKRKLVVPRSLCHPDMAHDCRILFRMVQQPGMG